MHDVQRADQPTILAEVLATAMAVAAVKVNK
jgi:hypothetical protein